jgi:hypothetical protein
MHAPNRPRNLLEKCCNVFRQYNEKPNDVLENSSGVIKKKQIITKSYSEGRKVVAAYVK